MRREHLNFASLTCYILFQFDYVHVLFGTQLQVYKISKAPGKYSQNYFH
jgi:hypothetical protein